MKSVPLRIGINCIAINAEYAGGITSFTFSLLDGLMKLKTHHQVILFITSENKELFRKYERSGFQMLEVKNPPRFIERIEWQSIKIGSKSIFHLLKNVFYLRQTRLIDNSCDLLYTPTTILYSYNSKKPSVLSMHDIQHTHFAGFFTRNQLHFRNITYELSARHSDYLQASSLFIKHDFLEHFKFLEEDNIEIINECVNENLFADAEAADIHEKYGIPVGFLFYPAQLWPHKNHIT